MEHHRIPATPVFNGEAAQKGYALNKMCFSFNSAEKRAEFLRDEDSYCERFGLTPEQHKAVRDRNAMIAAATSITLPSSPAFSASTSRTSARSRPA